MTIPLSQRSLNNVHPRLKQGAFATQVQYMIDLVQELKADVNTLITEFNTGITAVNVLATTLGKWAAILNVQRGAPHAIASSEYAAAVQSVASITATAPSDLL